MNAWIVRYRRNGEAYDITTVRFGQNAEQQAQDDADELRADKAVLWVKVEGPA